jgi:hypothetical protein
MWSGAGQHKCRDCPAHGHQLRVSGRLLDLENDEVQLGTAQRQPKLVSV